MVCWWWWWWWWCGGGGGFYVRSISRDAAHTPQSISNLDCPPSCLFCYMYYNSMYMIVRTATVNDGCCGITNRTPRTTTTPRSFITGTEDLGESHSTGRFAPATASQTLTQSPPWKKVFSANHAVHHENLGPRRPEPPAHGPQVRPGPPSRSALRHGPITSLQNPEPRTRA